MFLNRVSKLSTFKLCIDFCSKNTNKVCSGNVRRISSTSISDDISLVKPISEDVSSVPIPDQNQLLEPINFELDPLDLSNINVSLSPVREAWIENMSTPNSLKLGIVSLHPSIFASFPRPDIIQENHKWQTLYKHVDWLCMKSRAEVSGSNKKPWPQKGTGRARHSSRKAPQWKNGGWVSGPRGPRTYFYMLPWHKRVTGLISTLTAKLAQNDLHVVDTLETFPQDGTSAHLEELCEVRGWGPSVLFVDKMELEMAPKCTNATHFFEASEGINHINVVPVYGLNVFSMLKHETLVLTLDAIKDIEQKLLFQLKRIDLRNVIYQYKPSGVYRL